MQRKEDRKMEGTYTRSLPDYGHLMTVEDFRNAVKERSFIDYDGFGYAAKPIDGMMRMEASGHTIYPSRVDRIPNDATHIVWFNK